METFEDLREEEEEDSQEESDSPLEIPPPEPAIITAEQQEQVKKLLDELRTGKRPTDNIEEVASDVSLNSLNYQDFPALRRARAKLTIKGKDPKIDIVFRARITAMAGAINLYLDPELSYTWREASLLVAKSQGRGSYRARSIRTWIHKYLTSGKLPLHFSGRYRSSILEDEDIAQNIQLHLVEIAKNGYIRAQDVVDFVATEKIQDMLGSKKRGICVRTAQRWLHKLDWRYGHKKRGMYIDGHEWDDVVKYRGEFTWRWKEYEKRMVTYDKDGNESPLPPGFAVPQIGRFRLILVTHDESTFYAHDRRKNCWSHESDPHAPERKGDGPSLMISDMLTSEWGHLSDGEE